MKTVKCSKVFDVNYEVVVAAIESWASGVKKITRDANYRFDYTRKGDSFDFIISHADNPLLDMPADKVTVTQLGKKVHVVFTHAYDPEFLRRNFMVPAGCSDKEIRQSAIAVAKEWLDNLRDDIAIDFGKETMIDNEQGEELE